MPSADTELVKVVKPSNPKGWHRITRAMFDPSIHKLWEEPSAGAAPSVPAEVVPPAPEFKRGPGRPRKSQ